MGRRQMKMDGYIDVPDVVLRGHLETDYTAWHEDEREGGGAPYRRIYVAVLSFGERELARWDVTGHRKEFEPQPGDYWNDEDRQSHEEAFVEKFIAGKLAPMFAGLDGAIKD